MNFNLTQSTRGYEGSMSWSSSSELEDLTEGLNVLRLLLRTSTPLSVSDTPLRGSCVGPWITRTSVTTTELEGEGSDVDG